MTKIEKKRQTSGLSAISKAIRPLAKQLLGKKGFVEIDLLTNWENIVGTELAQFSFPQKINFRKDQKNNGTLHIQVPSGAFALEIQHREKFITEKINSYFGYNAVSGIKIIQNNELDINNFKEPDETKTKNLLTAAEENYINDMADDIKNIKLKEILTKLGKSVFNNNNFEK